MPWRKSESPAAAAGADAPASRASPIATLRIVSPRRIVGVHGKHERRGAADQSFDQRELLVGVVDERGAADGTAFLALCQDVERPVVVARLDPVPARRILV